MENVSVSQEAVDHSRLSSIRSASKFKDINDFYCIDDIMKFRKVLAELILESPDDQLLNKAFDKQNLLLLRFLNVEYMVLNGEEL